MNSKRWMTEFTRLWWTSRSRKWRQWWQVSEPIQNHMGLEMAAKRYDDHYVNLSYLRLCCPVLFVERLLIDDNLHSDLLSSFKIVLIRLTFCESNEFLIIQWGDNNYTNRLGNRNENENENENEMSGICHNIAAFSLLMISSLITSRSCHDSAIIIWLI
jgi:hypothetical protein